MSPPTATSSQLLAVVDRARRKTGSSNPILLRADPNSVPETRYEVERINVVASRSPLEIRALVSKTDGDTLVVVTDCDHHDLGADLMARVAGGRIWTLNQWETVKDMFVARHISRDLTRRRYLADALIESRPLNGYPPVRSGILDIETALSALLREYLKIPEDLDTLDGFVQWAMRKDAAHLLVGTRADVSADLRRFLVDRYGAGVRAVLSIVQAGRGDDLIPIGLASGVIHHPLAPDAVEARLRLQYAVQEASVESDAWRALATVVERLVRGAEDPQQVAAWQAQSDMILEELKCPELAFLSDLIPSGFSQRTQRAAEALRDWYAKPDGLAEAQAVEAAIDSAARHQWAEPARIERMRMAARMIRRGNTPIDWGDRLSEAATAYQRDGAWLDWARLLLSRSERNKTLSELYTQLVEEADVQRHDDNQRFAVFGSGIASLLPSDVIGIENIMAELVAPVAAEQPVLVVVLDGMGWNSFLEVRGAISTLGWSWYRPTTAGSDRAVIATLPTVTEFSRTSLFAGKVRKGSGESERRAFQEHAALLSISKTGKPPVLHHKAGLRRRGLDSIPKELLADIADNQRQVVAVVLNNIDERLKDVVAPPEGWDLPELDPLRWLLQEAQEAGRAVILTADHGHIIDRDAEQIAASGGGERWKPAGAEVDDGEIQVSGARVIGSSGKSSDTVVLPWVEQRRYATRRNGYHGGITPQEVLVPFAILSIDEPGKGWEPVLFTTPAWWHHRPPQTAPLVAKPPKRPKPVVTPSLFDDISHEDVDWLDAAIEALQRLRTPLIRLSDAEIRSLLSVLDEHGGMSVSFKRLAEMSGLSSARIGRYVSQLQQLVNIDGYGIVTTTGQEVRLDRPMLERQLGLA